MFGSLRTLGLVGTSLLAVHAIACSVTTAEDAAEAEAGSTHALVTVTRTASATAPEEVRADAFASFLRASATADAGSVLRGAGLSVELPAAGECHRTTLGQALPAGPVTRAELLDVGEVTLVAGGSVTTLAPRAFPTVTDSISGVVYTTRDRTAAPLPAGSSYTIATTGGSALGPLSGEGQAPAALAEVKLAGVAFAEVGTLPAGQEIELAWAAGSVSDRLYVEIDSDAGASLCAFHDETGHGVVPAAFAPPLGEAVLSVHRLRQVRFSEVGLSRGELRFDFELSRSVSFE
jgi:hypothetical protein